MEGSIVFYTYGSTLELYGQQFTAGMLTADLLNLSPDEYHPMDKRMKRITSLAEEYKQMWVYIVGGILLFLAVHLIVQGIRCNIAVKESKERLATYGAETVNLSYGKMSYVDTGEGEVILSVHGIFGGYAQAYHRL